RPRRGRGPGRSPARPAPPPANRPRAPRGRRRTHRAESARGPLPAACGDLFMPLGTGYAPHVATILLAGGDLFFRGKLEAPLPGHHLVTTDSIDPPDLVIADIARIEPDEVADAYPDCPILAYANHSDTAGLRRAHAAGFDQIVVKAALAERVPQIVEDLTA